MANPTAETKRAKAPGGTASPAAGPPAAPPASVPRPGMFATVRNRHGVISSVEPFDHPERGRLHLVHIEYKDDGHPYDERLLWEIEANRRLLEPNALPEVGSSDPMPAHDFDALLRATRWTAATPYIDPDGDGPLERLPISSPFHGAVQVDDFQLVPLLKALRMPRVNLLLADDVGLGKTVEAGLILTELLLRRRIQHVLILAPASLRDQWQEEMWDKFSLTFDIVDRGQTYDLRRRLGMDANPWRAFPRVISSYHYLRQSDVLDSFLAACRTPEGSPHLPWDLLIVDECHNLMPSAFGNDSDLCRMLRLVAPQFEHRLFLSATPHNGHTRCFTGLLEILDPVRFSQTDELKPAERERIRHIVIRRLKREINARTNPPKFCNRLEPRPIMLTLSDAECALHRAFSAFRAALRKRSGDRGTFAVEILGKRLLSCPVSFAESWRRCKEGLAEQPAADDAALDAARRLIEQETGDDQEAQSREATAAGVVGAWLKPFETALSAEIAALDAALDRLGLNPRHEKRGMRNEDEEVSRSPHTPISDLNPTHDARLDALLALIDELLRRDGSWRPDERLVVFTEYKTTLDYVVRRLRERFESGRILTLYGSGDMKEKDRKPVITAFNDPADPVRILVATDTASEGLNLQRTARYLLHYDCPWNPSKLEQRNGRIDRHGQSRDVTIHYFVTEQDEDLSFQGHIIRKANEIREDLGSVNELFDEAAHRRLLDGEDLERVKRELDLRIAASRHRASYEADDTVLSGDEGREAERQLKALAEEIDLTPNTLRDTLEAALAIRVGRPQLEDVPNDGTCKLLRPDLPGWSEVIDESLRVPVRHDERGPVSRLAFSVDPFLEKIAERTIYHPRPDIRLVHLSHPMMQRALSLLTRRRFPGTGEEVSRWTARTAALPPGDDAWVLLSVEELAVNDLRETFHHWVRTLIFPVRKGRLAAPLPHQPALKLNASVSAAGPAHVARARDLLIDVERDLRDFLTAHAESLTGRLAAQLKAAGAQAKEDEQERYKSRQGEISSLIHANTLQKLQKEIEKLKREREQGLLFDERSDLARIDRSIEEKEAEIQRRRDHYEEVKKQLDRERERILKRLLPRRHAMNGRAQVFPVALEVRMRDEERGTRGEG